MRFRSAIAAWLTLLALVVALPAQAIARDTDAPRGAPNDWLPSEAWVMRGWMPFDEASLYTALGVNASYIRRWLAVDGRTIAQLAHKRNMRTAALARQLVARRQVASAKKRRVLYSRSLRMLTQSHLSQHVLFHTFHNDGMLKHTDRIFGVTPENWYAARRQATPLVIAERNNLGGPRLRLAILQALKKSNRIGARQGWTSRRQAKLQTQYQEQQFDGWICTVAILR